MLKRIKTVWWSSTTIIITKHTKNSREKNVCETCEIRMNCPQTKSIINKPLLNSTHNFNGERWKYQNNKLIKIDQWPDILMNENIHGPKML